jgi:DNA-binding response OmpR family regulator
MSSVKRVLVVDDDASILEALELTFEAFGYRTRCLAAADKVYATVKDFKPDVIVLDVLLSGFDGKEVCKKLKADKTTRGVPVIMVSAHPDMAMSARASGANDFLEKPFELDSLIKKVEQYAG